MIPVSPLSHLIAFVVLGWIAVHLHRVAPAGRPGAERLIIGSLFAWIAVSSALASRGVYLAHNDYLAIFGGIAMPVAILAALSVSPAVRELGRRFVDETPPASFVWVHVLRVLAAGSIYKGWIGALPVHFILPVAVPDLLVGLSAPFVARHIARDPEGGRRGFIVWNVIGAGVLMLAAPLMQLSQPGPLRLFTEGPRTDEVLGLPMSIVPTFVAPLLITIHAAAVAQALARRSKG